MFKIRTLLCKLGFHKYYVKTYRKGKITCIDHEFECIFCKKFIIVWERYNLKYSKKRR